MSKDPEKELAPATVTEGALGMAADRERKTEPRECSCGARFEVGYFDDRRDERAALPDELVAAACPACGKTKTLSLPAGAGKTLVAELADDGQDEGAGD